GYRVGIVSNSDGHKGRPGASYPGASLFGAYGGLTCILAEALSRDALLDALRRRHNYGTTGCRALLDVRAAFEAPATRFRDDPNLGTSPSENASQAMMGDILRSDAQAVTLTVEIVAPSPVERIELYNGLELLETYRPFEATGRRVRVVWEGSEYRGRGRETVWDGTATFAGVRVERTAPINFYNLDKRLVQHSPTGIAWQALTTGGHGGFDAWLDGSADDAGATLAIDTALVQCEVPLATLTHEDAIFDAGGLSRRLRVFRLPEENAHRHVALRRTIPLRKSGDNALYARATLENGHVLWSSPIYVFA
ncbi:MAG: DUF3604 domain-containing protein, partial [Candidatus Eremiobacteraeota bacterium]|nr:DUF3604 domain-containing protein [Candidatus Eremiobacteraeota bacterium]